MVAVRPDDGGIVGFTCGTQVRDPIQKGCEISYIQGDNSDGYYLLRIPISLR